MTEKNGCCIYCGQIAVVKVNEEWTESEVNRQATLVCECDEAQRYQRLFISALIAKENIKKMIPADSWSEAREIMYKLVDMIASRKIDSVTIMHNKEKIKISITTKSSIKVEKVETLKEVAES